MADLRVRRSESGQTKIRNVPIAVTPEGFWCCPSPAVFQKTIKNQMQQSKHKPSPQTMPSPASQKSSTHNAPIQPAEKKQNSNSLRSRAVTEDQKSVPTEASTLNPTPVDRASKPNVENPQRKISVGFGQQETSDVKENPQRKISVGFGQQETSDVKLLISGKENIVVRMSVHKAVLAEHSIFFEEKFSRQSPASVIEIRDCEDVEIYVETVGLMYCKEMKQRLIKLCVARTLRVLKVAESLGFRSCIKACLEYLEAAPWVGDEEENVVSSVRRLQSNKLGITPILKRVSSEISYPPKDTLAQIMELVLKSNDDRGRREMKSLVLKLLRENNLLVNGSADICIETLYRSCWSCLHSLLDLFRQAAEPGFSEKSLDNRDPVVRRISLEADNLLWLVEILADRHVGDEFAKIWASQSELATLHGKLPVVSRHLVSCVTARLYVGIGRGEILPSKDVRQLLLQIWLQPLIEDYSWLHHGCRSFDRKVVEEGIGRTILTLPLEDQQSILLSWLGSFLKVGDNCPNLQRAFEVWWRRTFIRPYVEQQANTSHQDKSTIELG